MSSQLQEIRLELFLITNNTFEWRLRHVSSQKSVFTTAVGKKVCLSVRLGQKALYTNQTMEHVLYVKRCSVDT